MEYRLGCMALVFALTGCFSDPPSSGSSGGSSTSSTTGGSSGEASESTEAADDSSSSGGGSSSTGVECDLVGFDIPTVESDVVVLIDQGAGLDPATLLPGAGALTMPGTNVAVLVHTDDVPELPLVACDAGCGACEEMPATRVVYPYEDGAVDALLNTAEYECILRDPPPGNPTTGPTKHLWLITNDPGQELPAPFFQAVADLGLRVHLSCPGCDDNFGTVSGDLINVVTATLGTVSDSDDAMEVGGHAELIAASRLSCGWIPEDFPPYVVLELLTGEKEPEYAFLSEIDEGGCEPDGFFAREIEGAPAPAVTLCPPPCMVAQTLPADLVQIYGCY